MQYQCNRLIKNRQRRAVILPARHQLAHGNFGWVELVDPSGAHRATMPVAAAHQPPGHLHRAFSVVIVDIDQNVLLQRRSPRKERWPEFIANSCCGHPTSYETLLSDARKRVKAELGVKVNDLQEAGSFIYQATHGSWSEHEYDHVLLARVNDRPKADPDPSEVAELLWRPLGSDMNLPDAAPWLPAVLESVRKLM